MRKISTPLLGLPFAVTVAGMLVCASYASKAEAGSSNPATSLDKSSRNFNNALAKRLSKAASKAGIIVEPEHTVSVVGDGLAFVGAPIEGIESVPAVQLPNGVNAGFIFLSPPLDSPSPPVPTGLYTFRVSASEQAVQAAFDANTIGTDPPEGNAQVNLVDLSGNVVSTHTAYLQHVRSLTVAPGASRAGNHVDVSKETTGGGGGSPTNLVIQIWYQSSSGWRVCVKIVIRDL